MPCLLKDSSTVDSCSAGFFFSWMHIHFLIYPYIESNGSKAIEVYTNVSLAFFPSTLNVIFQKPHMAQQGASGPKNPLVLLREQNAETDAPSIEP